MWFAIQLIAAVYIILVLCYACVVALVVYRVGSIEDLIKMIVDEDAVGFKITKARADWILFLATVFGPLTLIVTGLLRLFKK